MGIRNSRRPLALITSTVVAVSLAGPAFAGANRAVEACKDAIAEDQGTELMTRLKKISPRGGSYEAWFNLSDGDTQLKAYCLSKRSGVQLITSEGSWTSRNPQRPG